MLSMFATALALQLFSPYVTAENIALISPAVQQITVIQSGGVHFPFSAFNKYWDFDTDDSLYKYVSPTDSLGDVTYKPADLVSLESIPHINVSSNEGKLRAEAAQTLSGLVSDFYKTFGKTFVIVSSYRGYAYQQKLFSQYSEKYGVARASLMSALPGHSEHQLGLAFDMFSASTSSEFASSYGTYTKRMQENAHRYGWTQSYQKGKEIDGYMIEPWHWRYVGVEIATYLKKHNMTFAEFVKLQKTFR